MSSITIEQRVRYVECDPMGVAHHSVYPVWFEAARTELLRQHGPSYEQLEREGVYAVVVDLSIKFRRPARYDQLVRITATLQRSRGVRIEHGYQIHHDGWELATGTTTLACVDEAGQLQPVPEALRFG